uniref:B-cell receptor CD22 n=1 Tax=Maylandia zebra TaxID=106582 RepID=A0A3P9CAF2_9CICH
TGMSLQPPLAFAPRLRVVLGQDVWGVTYTSTQICAVKGSTVELRCTFRYPWTINGINTRVVKKFWFIRDENNEPVDLKTESEYRDRVQYQRKNNDCTLRISDLRESDSAEYKFRFITNDPRGKYTGSPGVILTVTDLQVQVSRSAVRGDFKSADLKCESSCPLPDNLSYIWYKNERIITGQTSNLLLNYLDPTNRISCAFHDSNTSPKIWMGPTKDAPKLPSVSVSPSAEIVEGSSVTLTCSSDANPAPSYTWYKDNKVLATRQKNVYHFISIKLENSGNYSCKSENQYGQKNSTSLSIDVQYAPKLPSVSVSPSAEIVEGSSVTLTCSSDANPAAKYTWYKEDEDSPKASGHNFTISNIRPEHSGSYYLVSDPLLSVAIDAH